jgi:hypothetical protein
MMVSNEKLKIAVIAGAAHAAEYKEKNPRASMAEILANVTRNVDFILKQIDGD